MTDEDLTLEQLDRLLKAAGYHQEPLRVTPDFLVQVRRIPSPPMVVSTDPPLPIGTEVHVVWDGTENIKLVDGEWTFVPTPKRVRLHDLLQSGLGDKTRNTR